MNALVLPSPEVANDFAISSSVLDARIYRILNVLLSSSIGQVHEWSARLSAKLARVTSLMCMPLYACRHGSARTATGLNVVQCNALIEESFLFRQAAVFGATTNFRQCSSQSSPS